VAQCRVVFISKERPVSRPPLPPFNAQTAAQKARLTEDAWNSRDPARVALAYTDDSRWHNRAEFFAGRAAIEAFRTHDQRHFQWPLGRRPDEHPGLGELGL
jgi:nuclear transport factor 2 (NTF2) superfamily protein